MDKDNNRKPPPSPDIAPELAEEAIEQLTAEIALLEEWLSELDRPENATTSADAHRRSYLDKLRSRREMRDALQATRNRVPPSTQAD